MKPKIALEKLGPLLTIPSFTSREAKELGVSSATVAYYVKTGDVRRIGRGIYRGTNAQVMEDFRWEDLAAAVAKVKNGVVCFVSALALYGLTEEIPRQHWIAINNNTRHRVDTTVKIVRLRNMETGKTTITVGGLELPIFDRERTIVDSFRYLGVEIAIKALRTALSKRGEEKIDIEKIRQYAKILRVKINHYLLAETT